jgi:hypothetical protein
MSNQPTYLKAYEEIMAVLSKSNLGSAVTALKEEYNSILIELIFRNWKGEHF